MNSMSALDASFLHFENDVNHMHIAAVAILEGPPPRYAEILEMVESKLHRVPRYRQKVRFVPADIGRPVWVDDPHFNIQYHVRHTAMPSPGSDEQLRNLVGRVMAQQLDRAKPLWELWVAEGLQDGRWAILSKTHHCMVDGVSGSELVRVLMDDNPNPEHEPAPAWEPESEPSTGALLAEAVRQQLSSPYHLARSVGSRLAAPRRLAAQFGELLTGVASLPNLFGSDTSKRSSSAVIASSRSSSNTKF